MSNGKMVIRSANVTSMKVGENNFEVTNQEGLLHAPNGTVQLVKFGVEKDKPYQPGDYEISMDSLHADKYGRLAFRPVLTLIPIRAAGAASPPLRNAG